MSGCWLGHLTAGSVRGQQKVHSSNFPNLLSCYGGTSSTGWPSNQDAPSHHPWVFAARIKPDSCKLKLKLLVVHPHHWSWQVLHEKGWQHPFWLPPPQSPTSPLQLMLTAFSVAYLLWPANLALNYILTGVVFEWLLIFSLVDPSRI
jgi:hypothetical protein